MSLGINCFSISINWSTKIIDIKCGIALRNNVFKIAPDKKIVTIKLEEETILKIQNISRLILKLSFKTYYFSELLILTNKIMFY